MFFLSSLNIFMTAILKYCLISHLYCFSWGILWWRCWLMERHVIFVLHDVYGFVMGSRYLELACFWYFCVWVCGLTFVGWVFVSLLLHQLVRVCTRWMMLSFQSWDYSGSVFKWSQVSVVFGMTDTWRSGVEDVP